MTEAEGKKVRALLAVVYCSALALVLLIGEDGIRKTEARIAALQTGIARLQVPDSGAVAALEATDPNSSGASATLAAPKLDAMQEYSAVLGERGWMITSQQTLAGSTAARLSATHRSAAALIDWCEYLVQREDDRRIQSLTLRLDGKTCHTELEFRP